MENAARGGASADFLPNAMTEVVERDRYLLKEGIYTDVVFLVGPHEREFHCHRVYLAKTTRAFGAMLYGPMAARVGEPIRIPDATPEGFQAMLTYIYEGKVQLKTFSEASSLLQLSKKYLLCDKLQKQCRAQCWTLIYPYSVWEALMFALENEEEVIFDTAWQILCKHTGEMLDLEDVCDIPQKLLLMIVQADSLSCTELDLCLACIRWGKAEIARRDLQENEEGMHRALADITPHIRFLTMTLEVRTQVFRPPRIITEKQAFSLLMCKSDPKEAEALTGFNLTMTPRRYKSTNESFKVEGCSSDDLHYPSSVLETDIHSTTTFDCFTKTTLPKHLWETLFVGVVVPSQVKVDAAPDETYEEEASVYVFDYSTDDTQTLIAKTHFKGIVKYNATFDIALTPPPVQPMHKYPYTVITVFHKSGIYKAKKSVHNSLLSAHHPFSNESRFLDTRSYRAAFYQGTEVDFVCCVLASFKDENTRLGYMYRLLF